MSPLPAALFRANGERVRARGGYKHERFHTKDKTCVGPTLEDQSCSRVALQRIFRRGRTLVSPPQPASQWLQIRAAGAN